MTHPTDPARHETLRELAEAATPGPWRHHTEVGPYATRDEVWCDAPCKDETEWLSAVIDDTSATDAAYIAAANPSAVLSLLDESDAKDARIVELEGALEEIACQLEYDRDHYERNGPTYTSPGGQELEETEAVLAASDERASLARAALKAQQETDHEG